MKEEEIKRFLKKNVLLILKSGRRYNCKIITINPETTFIKDMFGAEVLVENDSIELIQEKKEENK